MLDTVLGIAVIIATLFGPVLAVWVTRHNDDRRQRRDRQMGVFRAIMGTRKGPISRDKVNALNMVEIEFYGCESVEKAYRALMGHINQVAPLPNNWPDEHKKLTTKLLTEMAMFLGYKLQQLDVLDGGYYPQAYSDLESEQQAVRRGMIEVLSGHRPLLVSPGAPTPPAPFPPPPTPDPQ